MKNPAGPIEKNSPVAQRTARQLKKNDPASRKNGPRDDFRDRRYPDHGAKPSITKKNEPGAALSLTFSADEIVDPPVEMKFHADHMVDPPVEMKFHADHMVDPPVEMKFSGIFNLIRGKGPLQTVFCSFKGVIFFLFGGKGINRSGSNRSCRMRKGHWLQQVAQIRHLHSCQKYTGLIPSYSRGCRSENAKGAPDLAERSEEGGIVLPRTLTTEERARPEMACNWRSQ